ncbi:pentatricopeptide repeat-containing family protein [Salix suchowensis]|nr:pentatricopeptide repeat-containing family protein [Salix suchowensis]
MNHSSSMLSPVAGCSALPPNSGARPKNIPNRRRHFISLLQNCKHNNQIPPIHAKIIRNHHDEDPFVVFELLRVCSNLNSIGYASKIFSHTQNPNVYLYTALIDGLVLSCSYTDGIHLYYQMINSSLVPDSYAIASVLKACGCHLALKEGREVHSQVLKLGLSSNRSIRVKLTELYGKCGAFEDARRVFDEMPERDVVASTVMINYYFDHGIKDTICWTAMIDGLVRNGESNRALEVFRNMQREKVMPNEVTMVCVLSACSELGALQLGRWVHSYKDKHGIELNHFVGGALINMYSRCGDIDEAQGFLNKALKLLSCLGINKARFTPSNVTFVGVLNACSHGGLAELGFEIFHSMAKDYGIEPQIEHYGCMVDLLGRLGRLEEAYNFITTMKVAPDHIHGNLELAERVAKSLVACKNADSGTYILLSNAYSSSGKWKEAAEVRTNMREEGIEKEPGCSSIEVNNEIHEFLLGDVRHPQRKRSTKS